MIKEKLRKYPIIVNTYRLIEKTTWDLFWVPYQKKKRKKNNSAIFCECCVYYKGHSVKRTNWGDDINKFFFEYVTGDEFVFIPYRKLSEKYRLVHYSLIGSIIGFYNLNDTIIYGSGMKDPDSKIIGKPKKIISVRGPLTRSVLLKNGIDCPEHYGDPALLLPVFYKPSFAKTNKIAVIPNMGTNDAIVNEWIKFNGLADKTIIIDLKNYKDWKAVIDAIVSCEIVISESLHGLIVSETYGVPNVWVEFVEHPCYWDFKYEDYFASIHKDETIIQLQHDDGSTYNEIIRKIKSWKKASIDYSALLADFPFDIKCMINNDLL